MIGTSHIGVWLSYLEVSNVSKGVYGVHDPSKRDLIKKIAYVAPTVLTMSAVASLSSAASGGAMVSSTSSMTMSMGMMMAP